MNNELKQRLISEFKRDWRRTGVLLVLSVVALFLLGRQMLGSGDPAEARGADSAYITQGQAATSRANGSGGSMAVAPTGPAVSRVSAPSGNWAQNTAVQLAAVPGLERDPFQLRLGIFPVDPNAETAEQQTGSVKMNDKAEAEKRDQIRRAREAAIAVEAGSIKLQSVMMTNPPRVMLNGTIYRAGQSVVVADEKNPFKITKITATSTVLEKEGFEVTLALE